MWVRVYICKRFSTLKLVQPLMHLKCDDSPSSFFSIHFFSLSLSLFPPYRHISKSYTLGARAHVCVWVRLYSQLCSGFSILLMFISRNKMNEIYLSSVFCLSFHIWLLLCRSLWLSLFNSLLAVIMAVTSHTINSLLHYTLNECAFG